MVHFLDSLPFDWTAPGARELRDLLADTYFRDQPIMQFAADAGVNRSVINWNQPAYLIWHELLEKSRNQSRLRNLIDVITNSADGAVAVRLREITASAPVVAAPLADGHVDKWQGFGDREALERQIQSMPALLDIAFLRRGVELAPAVARLLVTFPSGEKYFGTGFRITGDLLLTNHHVLYDVNHGEAPATEIEVWFGYEKNFAGDYLAHDVFMGETGSIRGSANHDWAVFRVPSAIPDTPVISLSGAAPVNVDDRVYIIQHPNGGAKQIAMIHNIVRHVDGDVVQYWADTQAGSSGSPVFNERWELVALHHRWVRAEAGGRAEFRNQGQRIEPVAAALRQAGVI